MAPVDDANRVHIFDTTLRDGEQSPGISLNTGGEGRDRPAAGPPGRRRDRGRLPDHLARRFRGGRGDRPRRRGPGDLRPGPHPQGRHRRRLGGDQGRGATPHPHLHLDLRHPHRAPAADRPRGRQGPGPRRRHPGQVLLRGRRVLADGRDPRRHRVHRRGLRDRGRGGRHRGQHPRHGRLHHARGVRGVLPAAVRAGAGAARGRDLGPLSRRPGPGRRQLLRRRAGRGAAGRVRRQRHRRARRQLLAGGDRDADQRPRGRRTA